MVLRRALRSPLIHLRCCKAGRETLRCGCGEASLRDKTDLVDDLPRVGICNASRGVGSPGVGKRSVVCNRRGALRTGDSFLFFVGGAG